MFGRRYLSLTAGIELNGIRTSFEIYNARLTSASGKEIY